MSTAELIYEKAKTLPEPLQTEALHYVDYLLARREEPAIPESFREGMAEIKRGAVLDLDDALQELDKA